MIAIADISGLFHRSYHALPKFKNSKGLETGMLLGFMNFILGLNKDIKADRIIFALDASKKSFRHEFYPAYKANRPPTDEALKEQIKIATKWISQMGFCVAFRENYEADDIIASLVKQYKDEHDIIIFSQDKDLNQLVEKRVRIFDSVKQSFMDTRSCFEKFKVYPSQFIDYQAIIGDSADNIKGIKGVGKRTAPQLLNTFASLDGIYDNIEKLQLKDREKFLISKDNAYLSKRLVTLNQDCFRLENLDDAKFPTINPVLQIFDELVEYDLKSVIQKVLNRGLSFPTINPENFDKKLQSGIDLIDNKGKKTDEFEAILLDTKEKLDSVIKNIKKDEIVAIDTETTSLDSSEADIVGFSFCINEIEAYYVPIAHETFDDQVDFDDAKDALLSLREKTDNFVYQNSKYDTEVIYNNFFIKLPLYHDVLILSWLFSQDKNNSLSEQVFRCFGKRMVEFKTLVDIKKGETFANVELDKACYYASEDAFYTFKLFQFYKEKCVDEKEHIFEHAVKYEYPYVDFMKHLEEKGIRVDRTFFQELKEEFEEKILNTTSLIYKTSGYEFNIKSPAQVSDVLFNLLGISTSGIKQTKTGYATGEEYLEKKINEHEVVKYIIEYKKMTKLYGTYIMPIFNRIQEGDSDILRASFSQTGTATGRLSSSNPNLQNIPVRTEEGKRIRQGFIAREGYKLVSVDYSQIELRLLAHFSKDPQMISAYKKNEDIHLKTAINLFGEALASEKRDVAKSINFGLIYGMGARKLASDLKIRVDEAKMYIEQYFNSFPTVKTYLQSLKEQALSLGYVDTILGRKQWFAFNKSTNRGQHLAMQREAVNSKFQGSASDILKVASMSIIDMIKDKRDISVLIQIHDELLFEIKEGSINEYKSLIIKKMESAVELSVPLKVSFNVANRWGDLK